MNTLFLKDKELYPISGLKLTVDSIYALDSGIFGVILSSMRVFWRSCRETFAIYLRQDAEQYPKYHLGGYSFVFSHSINEGEQIAKFFLALEEKLGLKDSIKISKLEDNDRISVVTLPNKWWLENFLRIHFLTMVLRCARNYEKNSYDFEKTLYSIDYASKTKPAVTKFLQGFTRWAGTEFDTHLYALPEKGQMTWNHGWVHHFEGGENLELMIK